MRIAVTGAAGFIGSHLSEELVARGHCVVGIDALTDAYAPERKIANLSSVREHRRFCFHRADVTDPRSVILFSGCDAIFHLAGLGGARALDEHAFEHANVQSVRAVVNAGAAVGARVVLASSSSVYGEQSQPTREDAPLRPTSPYGNSKLRGEEVACERAGATGAELIIARYFSVYGPRQRPDQAFARYINASQLGTSMPRFGDGSQRRDFTFVADIVRGTIAAMERGTPGGVYNLGGGSSVSFADAISMLQSVLAGGNVSLVPSVSPVHEPRATAADLSRARGELGYVPLVALSDGLAMQVAGSVSTYQCTPRVARTNARSSAVGSRSGPGSSSPPSGNSL